MMRYSTFYKSFIIFTKSTNDDLWLDRYSFLKVFIFRQIEWSYGADVPFDRVGVEVFVKSWFDDWTKVEEVEKGEEANKDEDDEV